MNNLTIAAMSWLVFCALVCSARADYLPGKKVLVIPASSLNADRAKALEAFINGIDDIKIGIKAYSRSGN